MITPRNGERVSRTRAPEDLQVLAEIPAARDERRDALDAVRAELDRVRSERDEGRVALAAAAATIRDQERALAEIRAELDRATARTAELEARPPEVAGTTLQSLLEERGLRGADEAERALAALSGSHLIG